ncbi:hypothetical protein C8F01DRAFT_943216, partial [Mycena amicta]
FVCSRGGTGGVKSYVKLHPEWTRKLPSKRTDCKCVLIVKNYPDTLTVLAKYIDEHNHAIANANLAHTHIPADAR